MLGTPKLREVESLGQTRPGKISLHTGVIRPAGLLATGLSFMPAITSHRGEHERRRVSGICYDEVFIDQGSGTAPRRLNWLIEQLDEAFPANVGDVSILRLRHYRQRPTFPGAHTDEAQDYRFVLPLVGRGEMEIEEPGSYCPAGAFDLNPGDVSEINNCLNQSLKVPHASRSISQEMLLLVYGRDLTPTNGAS
jgi:hypothetical protein